MALTLDALNGAKWISLTEATPDALHAELERRKAEAEAAEQARKEAVRDAAKRRKETLATVPARLAELRSRLDSVRVETDKADRPTPAARSAARMALLSGTVEEGSPVDRLIAPGRDALPLDRLAATFYNIMLDVGRLLLVLIREGAGDSAEAAEVDALECEAFDALYRRVSVLAGIRGVA